MSTDASAVEAENMRIVEKRRIWRGVELRMPFFLEPRTRMSAVTKEVETGTLNKRNEDVHDKKHGD